MVHDPEFVRGNQKSYIRIPCDVAALKSYEYQMCSYNKMSSLLVFQQRSQNGNDYLYYEISGMQSLDIYLQTQKLKRPFAIQLAKAIARLCKELSEYALDMEKVVFEPRYVMIAANGEEVRFLYSFVHSDKGFQELERLLEVCIDCLDYQDELLMEKLFGLYEKLAEQKGNVLLDVEMDAFQKALAEPATSDILSSLNMHKVIEPTEHNEEKYVIPEEKKHPENSVSEIKSRVAEKEYRSLKKGLRILLFLDIAVLIFWKPVTLLKVFFVIAVGIVLLMLNIWMHRSGRMCKNNRICREEQQTEKQESTYIEEYESLAEKNSAEDNYTKFIEVKDSEGILYNLQGCEPKCIYINEIQKIIGKDSERAQVQLPQEGISRIHALVIKEGEKCIIEDLNSTNGTWINGKPLEPRARYVLRQGDKVRFAGLEYIFR